MGVAKTTTGSWRTYVGNLLQRCDDQSETWSNTFDRLAETIVASDVRRTVSALLQEILEGVTIQVRRTGYL